ncbi:hypothetical protein BH11PLA2_BH11PLA2_19610 [soil metagenome]
MPSFRARFFEAFLRITGAKDVTNMIDLVYPLDAKHAKPTWRMKRRHQITCREYLGRTIYTIAPKDQASTAHVYYLHGGAYYNGFIPPQWKFLADIVTKTHCTITAPISRSRRKQHSGTSSP